MDRDIIRKRLWGRRKLPGWTLLVVVFATWLNDAVGWWANVEFLSEKDWTWATDVARDYWTPLALVGGLVWIAVVPNRERVTTTQGVESRPEPKRVEVLHRNVLWGDNRPNDPLPWCPEHGTRLLYNRDDQIMPLQGRFLIGEGWGSLYCPSNGGHRFGEGDEPWEFSTVQEEAEAILDGMVR